jgi:hypothetical protein
MEFHLERGINVGFDSKGSGHWVAAQAARDIYSIEIYTKLQP